MMYGDIANLVVVTGGKDADGFSTEVETSFEVYANKKSVARSEFFASLQAGINATAIFETRLCDFEEAIVIGSDSVKHKATRVEYDGDKYNIIRTYTKDNETLELTCSDLGA